MGVLLIKDGIDRQKPNATVHAHTWPTNKPTHRGDRTQKKKREKEKARPRQRSNDSACDLGELALSRGTLEQKIAVPYHPS